MTIQYYNRSRLSPDLEKGAKYIGFEELVRSSDVISLNCSLTKETTGLIGKKEFAAMKKGVIIVNTARGKLIDEKALVDALEEGKVFSAGLDVYEEEPKVNEGLLNNPNVVLLPHVGTSTWETQVCLNGQGEKCLCANDMIEKYGIVGFGELGECGKEGVVGYAGSGAGEQGWSGEIVNGKVGAEHINENIVIALSVHPSPQLEEVGDQLSTP